MPLTQAAGELPHAQVRIKSWWDFETVNLLRKEFYGEWEGMHATPSEISITQVDHRILDYSLAKDPPKRLTKEFIKTHAGDKHGPADVHRAQFPDGRVGSHSSLAAREHGIQLKKAAVCALVKDYKAKN